VLTEKGGTIHGAGDTPNEHDMLTGSQPDGRALHRRRRPHVQQLTSSADGSGSAQLATDRTGGNNTSWNSAHRVWLQPAESGVDWRRGVFLLFCD
jgi:hypothetical protein